MYLLSYFEGRAFSKLNQRKLQKNVFGVNNSN